MNDPRAADLRAEIGRIRIPSLIIGGERDESTPPAQAGELHTAVQGSQLVILPGVAHPGLGVRRGQRRRSRS